MSNLSTVAFANLKGGAGKTTSAVAIADALASAGAAVLFVDVDPQGTASAWLTERSAACRHLLTTGFDPERHVASVDAKTHEGRLDVLSSNRSLERATERRPSRLSKRLERLWEASEEAYDVALVDTPPQSSALVTAALLSVAGAVAPVAPGRGAMDGLQHVLEYTSRIGGAEIRAAFACNVDLRSKLHTRMAPQLVDILGTLDDSGMAARHYVRSTVQIQEAEAASKVPSVYCPDATAWIDYRALTAELAGIMGYGTPEVEESLQVTEEDLENYRAASSN